MPADAGRIVPDGSGQDSSGAWANWRIGDRRWKCRLGEDGLSSELSGTGPLALTLPAFDFDGEGATEIACDGRALSVSYKGWTCRYSTDGEIVDMDAPVSNRNGRYRVFEARGRDSLKVRISIFSGKDNIENKGSETDETSPTRRAVCGKTACTVR